MVNLPTETRIPFLENGDRLTAYEFERRYEATPDLKRAELIEGVVYVPAALRFKSHAEPHSAIMTWLGVYKALTPGVAIGDTPTVRLDPDNRPQPDAVLLIDSAAGGQARISADDYIEGAPELVVEVAASSAAIDLHSKKTVYRRNGVQEYIVWQTFENRLDWFSLRQGEYESIAADPKGILKSQVFPGLWLAIESLLQGAMPRVLAVLQEGLASAEHGEFLRQLAQR
jgi:Uma2 family endonuclease